MMKKIGKKIILFGITMLAFTFYNCKQTTKKEESSTEVKSVKNEIESKSESTQNKPELRIDLPNIDASSNINDVVSTYKSQINKVEAALPKLQKKEIKMNLFNTPNTPVTVWYSGNKPVKITYGVTGDSGEFDGIFTYYLKDDKLWFSDQIFAKYIFQNNKLKYWLDENWNVNDIPEKDFKDREKIILQNVAELISKVK